MKGRKGQKQVGLKIAGPIKLKNLNEAVERAVREQVKTFKTDILNHGDEVIVEVDNNGNDD